MWARHRVQPWMFVSAAWIAPAILSAINEIAQRRLGNARPPTWRELAFASGDWLLYACLTPGVFALGQRWPLTRERLNRVPLHVGMALLFCLVWALAGTALRTALTPQVLGQGFATVVRGSTRYFVSWMFVTFPFGVAVYFFVLGIEHAVQYFLVTRQQELEMAALSAQLSRTRFEVLQTQLNPHFLFNTLNTIAVLVRDNHTGPAANVIEHLSNILRRTLRPDQPHEVSIADELELVTQYLEIEQARFADRLRIDFDIDVSIGEAAIPAFMLQHLVDNAIRHGIMRRPEAGRVRVAAHRTPAGIVVSVTDDGPGIGGDIPKGHGLDNTRARLRMLYGDTGTLTLTTSPSHGTTVLIHLPFRILR